MSKFLSGRQSRLKLGVSGYTESKTVLQTTGKVGIGTTDAQSYSLFVVGDTNITGVVSATQFIGDGSNLANTGATLSAAAGTQRLIVSSLTSGTMVDAATDSDLTFNAATNTLNTDNLVVAGNLTVSGDQTILNVTQLEVEDINIGIASASSKLNNAQLNGAGITIHGSQGDKTLTWDNSNSRLGFNTDLYVPKVETAHAQITGGISTDGYDTGNSFELMRADGNGGWEWATVPGIFSVNNILNGFNVQEEGLIVGTAGSIHTLDFRGINVTAAAGPQPNGIATVTFSTRPSFDETYINGLTTSGRLVVSGVSTFSGEIDANGRIVAAATNNVIPFLYSNLGDLPSAVSFHGAFAHVHGTGKAYYAHAANWYELVNKESNGVVGTGTETYNIGNTQITGTANVGSAITMYGSTGIVSATAFYGDGSNLSNTGATLSAASGVQRLVVTDLTSGTMVDASTDGDLTFTASNNTLTVPRINVSVGATFGGTITAGSSEGVVGQYLRHVGAGVTWANFPTLRTTSTIIATDGQTVFGFTHNTNFLDVFVNGVKLSSSEYTSDGSNVTLSVGSFAGDVVELHSYNTASTYGSGGGGGGISLTDLSVTTAGSPLQLGALAYNNSNGVFTFTPPDVEGQSRQALSVGTANSPLQIGAISYNNGTGVFTYTPPDLSSYLTSYTETDTLASVTGRGSSTNVDLTFGGGLTVAGVSTFSGKTRILDNVEFHVGTNGSSGDYKFYRDSSNTRNILYEDITGAEARFVSNLAGDTSAAFHFLKASTALARFSVDSIQLYSGGAIKLDTSANGVTVTGTLAATAVTGDGSGLTGLTGASAATYGGASVSPQITVDANGRITGITNVSIAGGGGGGGSSIILQDNQSLVGAAGTIDFGTGLSVSAISAGVATVTAAGITTHDVNTNTLNVAGVSTFNGNVNLSDNDELRLGNSNDLRIYHSGFGRIISTGGLTISADDDINLDIGTNVGDTVNIRGGSGSSETLATFAVHGSVDLYYDAAKKFETLGAGVTVTGTTFSNQLSVSGIATATTFSGSGASLTTLNASELDSGTIPDARFPATLPAASGANLTNLPAANITGTLPAISGANLTNLDASDLASGTIPDARFPATLPAVSGANLTNLPSPTPADTDVQVTYDISANGNNYRITGPGYDASESNPDLYLVRGQRYRFINGTGSGHPFAIRVSDGGAAYTDGVSGSQSGTQDFNVQNDAPVRLYYQCTIHSGMIGNIYVVGGSDWRMTDVATNATPDIFTNLNVGIGTDNPESALHVAGTIPNAPTKLGVHIGAHSGYGIMQFSAATGGIIDFGESGVDSAGRIIYTHSDDTLKLQTANAERLRISSAGLAINKGSAADTGIEVVKSADPTIRLYDTRNAAYKADFIMGGSAPIIRNNNTSTSDRTLTIQKGTSDRLVIDGNGSMGLGTIPETDGQANSLYFANGNGNIWGSGNANLYTVVNARYTGAGGWKYNNSNVASYVAQQSGVWSFHNASSGSADAVTTFSEKLRIQSGGGISFNGDTAAANALDDYEEGTFTATITPGSGSYSYSYGQTGYYRKIGTLVFINVWIHLSTSNASGSITFSGLPFNCQSSSRNWIPVGGYGHGGSPGNSAGMWLILTQGAATGTFLYVGDSHGSPTNTNASHLPQSAELYINGSYISQ